MRLTFPRLGFIVIAGAAFAMCGKLAWMGYAYGREADEIRRNWATTQPSTMASGPETLPAVELSDVDFEQKLLEHREAELNIANRLKAQSRQWYLYCFVLTALWGIAAMKTWNRRWPGDRD